MADSERYVCPNPEGGWDVTGPDRGTVDSHHATASQAIAWTKTVFRESGIEGKIVYKDRSGHESTENV